jgi:hypothetical protein
MWASGGVWAERKKLGRVIRERKMGLGLKKEREGEVGWREEMGRKGKQAGGGKLGHG